MGPKNTPLQLPKEASINYNLAGAVNETIQKGIMNWFLPAPKANPIMLDMFRQREQQRRYKLMPWSGEFAGKYLTAAVQVLRLTNDKELKDYLFTEKPISHE